MQPVTLGAGEIHKPVFPWTLKTLEICVCRQPWEFNHGKWPEHRLTREGGCQDDGKCFKVAGEKGWGHMYCAVCEACLPTQGLSSDRSFTIRILGLGPQGLLSNSRVTSQTPSSSAIAWLPRQVLKNFRSTLASKLTMAETLRPRPRKVPRARGQVQFDMVAFSLLHPFHGYPWNMSEDWDAESHPLTCYRP